MSDIDSDGHRELVDYIKDILQTRLLPTNYVYLRQLIKEAAPSNLQDFVNSKYPDDKFLNFLLAHSGTFDVSSDGTVNLIGGMQYALPLSIDTVDCPTSVSDENYFGDREEYLSDSEEDGETSSLVRPNIPEGKSLSKRKVEPYIVSIQDSDSMTSSESFLSSEFDSRGSTSSNSHSSFESCRESKNNASDKDLHESSVTNNPSSSSYSSCSDV